MLTIKWCQDNEPGAKNQDNVILLSQEPRTRNQDNEIGNGKLKIGNGKCIPHLTTHISHLTSHISHLISHFQQGIPSNFLLHVPLLPGSVQYLPSLKGLR